jgi:Putative MetA-pathway of phenol degradation
MRYFTLLIGLSLASMLSAQSPTDGLMMPGGDLCNLLQYTHNSFHHYWEGELKRDNPNIGTISNQNVMLMCNYGITSKLNAMVALPYIRTGSDSYLTDQKGIQDLSLWLKWQPWQYRLGKGEFKVQTTGGVSTPLTNYVADFLPLSIGMQSRAASLRAILNYTMDMGLYITTQGGHTWRSDVTLDRNSFMLGNEVIYSDQAPVPNVFDYTVRLGMIRQKWQAELWLDSFTGLSGDNIRYNEMPQLTNKMRAISAGIMGKYYFGPLAIQASAAKVLSGRNVGESTMVSGGIFYIFHLKKAKS